MKLSNIFLCKSNNSEIYGGGNDEINKLLILIW